MCTPRFDSPPLLGRLLDQTAGHFSVRPAEATAECSRAYRASTLVLDTKWTCSTGDLLVTDAMAMGLHEHGHDLGRTAPGVLLRRVTCTRGTVAVRIEYAPRPEFGLIHPRLSSTRKGVLAEGGSTVILLSTDTPLRIDHSQASGDVTLHQGDEITFALEQHDAWGPPPRHWKARKVRRRLDDTEASWHSWSSLHQNYEGPLRDMVLHSGVVLQGLTYARSGAMVAAPTTSLPEGVGSGRTWDYRYTWVRDASMTMQGLYIAACPDEAARFFAYLSRAAATQLDRGLHLQIMFGIAGERDLSERELTHLAGWRDSPPVRVGNDAWNQHQLDVYGAVLDAAYILRHQLADMDSSTRSFLVAAVNAAAARWTEDDQGIWEFRGAAKPFLHSKLMCWVALDRGVLLAEQLRLDDAQVRTWTSVRDEIRETILARGWNESAGAYTQSFGSENLDASVLMLAIVGFLPATDPRLNATIDAVERELGDRRGLIYRYRGDDGFSTNEGTFLLCTFWLAHALALTGQTDRARTVLHRAADCATDLGLFAEQTHPETAELLGNFPQAFSHLGLITAAQALGDAERSAS